MGIGTVIGLIAQGATLGSALASVYGTVGAIAIQLGAGALLNAGVAALRGRPSIPSAPRIRRDLEVPRALQPKRYVYGFTRAAGSPVFWHADGRNLYMCYLFNSRPSEGPFTVYMDNRELTLDGDITDFSGPLGESGASDTGNGASWTFWLGLGDQTRPPDALLDALPEELQLSDGFEGCTVLWARFRTWDRETFMENFPNSPPKIHMVGRWSRVWDPRDAAQDPDDATTWTWSRNHARVVLDVLRNNPVRPYGLPNLLLDSWKDGATICDGERGIKGGGTETLFGCGGTLVFDQRELMPLVEPIMDAAAARFSRVAGRLGYVPAVWTEPVTEITNILDQMSCESLQPGDDLPTVVECRYTSPAREYESAALSTWQIPGAAEADGGERKVMTLELDGWCDSPYQAMHVRKITALRARHQKRLSGNAPAAALELVPGARASVAFPAPLVGRNGTYMVTAMNPTLDVLGKDGVALRCPLTLHEDTPEIYAYDPDVDEEQIQDPEEYDGARGFAAPDDIGFDTGTAYDRSTGSGVVERIKIFWSGTSAGSYEMQWQIDGDAIWNVAPEVPEEQTDGAGNHYAFIDGVDPIALYRARVRAVHLNGVSPWTTLEGISIGFGLGSVSLVPAPGGLSASGTTPDVSTFAGLRLWRGPAGGGFEGASVIAFRIGVEGDAAFTERFGPDVLNLVASGNFDDATGWTVPADWAVTGGAAEHTPGGTGALTYELADLEAGSLYRVAFDVVGRSQGSVEMRLVGSGTFSAGPARSADGTYVQDGPAPDDPLAIAFVPSTDFDGGIDNVRVYPSAEEMLPIGEADFWLTPVTLSDRDGPRSGPFTLNII